MTPAFFCNSNVSLRDSLASALTAISCWAPASKEPQLHCLEGIFESMITVNDPMVYHQKDPLFEPGSQTGRFPLHLYNLQTWTLDMSMPRGHRSKATIPHVHSAVPHGQVHDPLHNLRGARLGFEFPLAWPIPPFFFQNWNYGGLKKTRETT